MTTEPRNDGQPDPASGARRAAADRRDRALRLVARVTAATSVAALVGAGGLAATLGRGEGASAPAVTTDDSSTGTGTGTGTGQQGTGQSDSTSQQGTTSQQSTAPESDDGQSPVTSSGGS